MIELKECVAALPPIRVDAESARPDLEEFGIALLRDAIPRADTEEALAMAIRLAAAERAEGSAMVGLSALDSANQRVWGLVHKAPVFRRIATNRTLHELAHAVLGPQVTLYGMQVHVVGPGGQMFLHWDQSQFLPPPDFPCMATAIVMLEEFTAENGATQVAVGSHRTRTPPEATTPLIGKPGTVAFYGGQLWHSTGVNRTDEPRYGLLVHFCLPWVRQFENYQRNTTAAALRSYPRAFQDLVGVHDYPIGFRWSAIDETKRAHWIDQWT